MREKRWVKLVCVDCGNYLGDYFGPITGISEDGIAYRFCTTPIEARDEQYGCCIKSPQEIAFIQQIAN